MKDEKTKLIIFLLIIVISLLFAFLGKIVAIFFEFKPIYGILIGFFFPTGVKSILVNKDWNMEDILQTIGMFIFLFLVPTVGLSIIFVPLVAIILFITVAAINGVKEMGILLIEFWTLQYEKENISSKENKSKDIKFVKNTESSIKEKKIVKDSKKEEKDMKSIEKLENCNNNELLLLHRLDKLRENIAQLSNGEFIKGAGSAINVKWNWTNYFEIRLDNDKIGNIRIEIWVADVKHQWTYLAKVSSMEFITKQKSTYLIKGLDINADHYIKAYIKLGDSYGRTLSVADYELDYVKLNFNKQKYKDFYKTIGGQWKKNLDKKDFVRNDKLLTQEIQKMHLVNKDEIINYIKNEIRNVINLSLGTTVNISIPINELIKKDINFDYEKNIDELAKPLYDLIMEYKNKIES